MLVVRAVKVVPLESDHYQSGTGVPNLWGRRSQEGTCKAAGPLSRVGVKCQVWASVFSPPGHIQIMQVYPALLLASTLLNVYLPVAHSFLSPRRSPLVQVLQWSLSCEGATVTLGTSLFPLWASLCSDS